MRNIKLTIQYDGTGYFGWQRQKNTRLTISEIIEERLNKILGQKIKLIVAGRTDTGVHARMQVANFNTGSQMPVSRLVHSLNALLPQDIRILSAHDVAADFNSRYSARSKTYRYTILNTVVADVFLRRYVYHFSLSRLDERAMRRASKLLIGSHDFSSFKRTDKKKRTTVRDLKSIRVIRQGGLIQIDVTAKSFLYHMVRNIAGTLIEIGKGKLAPDSLREILLAKDRKRAGPTAPARGLCLLKVRY
jgi:tRNA pseudouridine38-40 synthase